MVGQRGQDYLWLFWKLEPFEFPTEFQIWERIIKLWGFFLCLSGCLPCKGTALDLVMQKYFYEPEEPSPQFASS